MTEDLDPREGDVSEPAETEVGEPAAETVVLSDGTEAELVPRDGGWVLEIDGLRQSHVPAPGEPPALSTARWMLAALGGPDGPDGPRGPRGPHRGRDRLVHLGGGLLTLPRVLAAQRPEVHQLVVESEPAIAALSRDRLGLPAHLTLEVGDARAWLHAGGPTPWAAGTSGAVVIDVFAGGRIPPAFTSRECFAAAASVLGDGGLLVVNSVACGDLTFLRRQVATLRSVLGHVSMIVQGSALHGLRFGNAVLVASDTPLDADPVRAALAGDPSRAALVTDLDDVVGGGELVVDADQLWSPEPDLPDFSAALRLVEQARALGQVFGPGKGPAKD